MTIYLDLIFIINFFFDFIILFGTKYVLKEKVKLYRIFFGSLIGTTTIIFLFLKINTIELFLFKVVISFLIIFVTFGKNNFFKNFLYFYIISIFLGGGMYFLNNLFCVEHKGIVFINNGLSINIIVMIIISPFIVFYYVKEHINYKNNITNCYLVDIYINNKKYSLKGYLDTGNTLIDMYKKRGVILTSLSHFNIKNKNMIYVPYKTITEEGVIKCYSVDKVIINNKEFNNLLIGDIKNKFELNNIDCLLPNIIREDL